MKKLFDLITGPLALLLSATIILSALAALCIVVGAGTRAVCRLFLTGFNLF